jgi:hypothetical protein
MKLIVAELTKKFPAFYRNQRTINMCIRGGHGLYPELSRFSPYADFLLAKIHFNIIPSFILTFVSGLFHSGFLTFQHRNFQNKTIMKLFMISKTEITGLE